MSLNLFEHVALAYQPIWGLNRQLAGVRLRLHALSPATVDAAHLLTQLANTWSDQSPTLVLSFAQTALLKQALAAEPLDGVWLEVPDYGDDEPPGMVAALAQALGLGHRLVHDAALRHARVWPATGPGQHRYLLHLWPEDVQRVQAAVAAGGEGSPLMSGQLYRDLGRREVAAHALDQRHAWGVCGWPQDDVLAAHRRYGVPVDKRTLVRVQQALMKESAMDHVEALIHQDAVLTYRVLRLVNSPVFGTSRDVTTVRQALMLLGQRRLRDWLLELMPGASADLDLLPVRLGLVLRAQIMENLMDAGVEQDLATEIYVTGLFSGLDRLTQEPLSTALRRVPVSEAMVQALLLQSGPYFAYYDIARRMESFEAQGSLAAFCQNTGFALDSVNRALLRTLSQWRNQL